MWHNDKLYCDMCSNEIEDGIGNNPEPFIFELSDGSSAGRFSKATARIKNPRVCDECNLEVVIPERLKRLKSTNKKPKSFRRK